VCVASWSSAIPSPRGKGSRRRTPIHARLEALLNAAGAGRWEVRNCGRRATDFPELYAAFEQILPFQPDVVVYGMVLNDADRSAEFQARQSYVNDWILDRGRILEGGAEPSLGPFSSRLFAMVEDRVETYRTSRATLRWYREMYGEPNRAGVGTHPAVPARHESAHPRRRRPLPGGDLAAPRRAGPLPLRGRPRHDRALLPGGRHPAADLLPVLRARPTESLWVHPVDMHPNEVAHRLAAESLAGPILALR
jgi:hypothetical protein